MCPRLQVSHCIHRFDQAREAILTLVATLALAFPHECRLHPLRAITDQNSRTI